ncbi:MAG: alkaline phosphatase family protein [Myxococcota bacterium]
MRITRRTALRGMAAAALTPVLPRCSDGSAKEQQPETPPSFSPALVADRIKHVVVLMMENRSFDHYFGALSLGGRADVEGLRSNMTNPLADGTAVGIAPADAFCVEDPGHGWNASHSQFNNGANDGFVREHEERVGAAEAHRVMGYFDGTALSAFYGLLPSGVLCQRWHASVMGPTWPNRYHLLCTHSGGNKSNEAIVGPVDSIFTRLDEKRIRWANYYGNLPFCVVLDGISLADPEFRYLEKFHEDAAAGQLETFTLIDPIYGRNDDHPPTHPVAGQVLLQSIYTSLARSPQWNETLFIVTYDEHGGFYDHVPPPKTVDTRAAEGFDQLGFRVPAMVLGPYVKAGTVSNTVLDHTSIFRTLATLWDLPQLTERDAAANSLLHVLDEQRIIDKNPAPPVELPPILATEEELHAPECDGQQFMPLPGSGGLTGQRELEELAWRRYRGDPRMRLTQTDEVYARFLDVARAQGVLRSRG